MSEISDAVETLVKALEKDENFYYSYQANIAMAFQDEYHRSTKRYKNRHEVHRIANNAAKHFLNLFMGR